MRPPHSDSAVSSVLETAPCPPDTLGSSRGVVSGFFRRPAKLLSSAVIACNWLGCGNTLYALRINSAAGRFEEARTMGAEEAAPYEYYFFSSRRRHTRLTCDWSSDVCSSD